MPSDQPDWTTAANPVPTLLATIALTNGVAVNKPVTVPPYIRSLVALSDQSLNWMLVMGNVSTISYLGGARGRQHIVGPFVGPPDTAVNVTGTPAATGTLWLLGVPSDSYPNSSDSLPAVQVDQLSGPGRYSVTGVSAPAIGTAASVVLAAVPGKAYTLAYAKASLTPTTAAVQRIGYVFLDGASTVGTDIMAVPATIDSQQTRQESQLGIPGSVGNSLTVQQTGMAAGGQGTVSVGAYLA